MPSVLSADHFHNEDAAYRFVEARLWANGRPCPHCGIIDQSGALRGKSTRIGVYKCYACRKPFTVKVGTIFESSHTKLHVWLQAIYLLCASEKGMSTHQLHRVLGVTLQTAWFLSHRIREVMKDDGSAGPLGDAGVFVEADETFVGGKARNRAYRAPAPKKAVVSLVERSGRVRSQHVPEANAANLRSILEAGIDKASHLRTDESGVYWKTDEQFASHRTVNHSQDEYVRGDASTNAAENFFSILKRGIYGTYQHVSEEHLHRYLAEFDFRHKNRMALGVDDTNVPIARGAERSGRAPAHLPNDSSLGINLTGTGRDTRPRRHRHRESANQPRSEPCALSCSILNPICAIYWRSRTGQISVARHGEQ